MAVRDILILIFKLLVASLVVGLVFRALNIQPRSLLRDLPDVLRDLFTQLAHIVDWAIPYVMLGAVVVIPVWAVVMLFRLIRRP